MATLVLGMVGGAIAGPVGAALGSLAGQAVDAQWLKSATRQGPRLSDLKVQTSSYGTALPRVFGTMRVAGCVIWSTDLLESRATGGGGKGQPATAAYSYAASFAVALSGRPVRRVGRIWADGNLLRGAAGDWKSPVGAFRLHEGGEDQPPDPLIAAAEGAAPAHRGIAYAVFEQLQLAAFGNRIPSLSFEVIADEVAPGLGAIAAELGGGVVTGGPAAALLAGFAAEGRGRDVLELLAQAAGGWWGPDGDGLALRTGEAAAAMVEDAGIAAAGTGAARTRSLAAIESVPRTVTVAHYDPARDYQAGVQRARRPGAGQDETPIAMPAAVEAGAAKALAEGALARAEADRTVRTVAPGLGALAVVPGDVVTVAGERGRSRVMEAALERWAVRLTLAPIAPGLAGVASPASAGRVLAALDLVAGRTLLVAAELPPLDDQLLTGPRLTVLAAGEAAGWRRASLLYSTDGGARWQEAGRTAAPATIGTLVVAPGPAPATLVDAAGAIEVMLAHDGMTLADTDDAGLAAGINLALVGDELVQFGEAQPLGGKRWRLARLWRGRRGTEAAAGTARPGDRFALVERGAAVAIDLPAASLGATVQVMAAGVSDDPPAVAGVAITGMSIRPPSPVHLAEARTADGGAALCWVRRSRVGWSWLDGVDAPLGEEAERYRVRWQGRDRVVEAPALLLSAAERRPGGRLEVRQLGSNGDGAPAWIDLAADKGGNIG